MINIRNIYNYEIELIDNTIITNHNNFNPDDVIRVSFIPTIIALPRHDLIFEGFKFKKRFCRVIMGWDSIVRESTHCVITDKFRFYLRSSNGQCLVTHKDYELKWG